MTYCSGTLKCYTIWRQGKSDSQNIAKRPWNSHPWVYVVVDDCNSTSLAAAISIHRCWKQVGLRGAMTRPATFEYNKTLFHLAKTMWDHEEQRLCRVPSYDQTIIILFWRRNRHTALLVPLPILLVLPRLDSIQRFPFCTIAKIHLPFFSFPNHQCPEEQRSMHIRANHHVANKKVIKIVVLPPHKSQPCRYHQEESWFRLTFGIFRPAN